MRSSFSGVLTSAFHGASPNASCSAAVPAAAAPLRAATSSLSCRAETPAKRVFGSRSSSFRSVLNVTPFVLRSCAPREQSPPCSATAQCDRSSGGGSRDARESETFRKRALVSGSFSPGSNGQAPSIVFAVLQRPLLEGPSRNRAEATRFRGSETSLRCENQAHLILEDPSVSACANSPCRGCACGRRISDRCRSSRRMTDILPDHRGSAPSLFSSSDVSSAGFAPASSLELERKPRCRAI